MSTAVALVAVHLSALAAVLWLTRVDRRLVDEHGRPFAHDQDWHEQVVGTAQRSSRIERSFR